MMPALTLGTDMARPSRTGGKKSETKSRNASTTQGRRIPPTVPRAKRRPASDPSKDLKEARAQQAATAEILKIIASSSDDTTPVFEAIAHSANRLIAGYSTAVYRFIDDMVHMVAFTPTTPEA